MSPTDLLPSGVLANWLLFVSALSLSSTLRTYRSLTITQNVYTLTPHEVTPLSTRTFSTWTLLSAIIRFYAAYNLADPVVYDIALWTFVVALGHFVSEVAVWRSAGVDGGARAALLIAGGTVGWMGWCRGVGV